MQIDYLHNNRRTIFLIHCRIKENVIFGLGTFGTNLSEVETIKCLDRSVSDRPINIKVKIPKSLQGLKEKVVTFNNKLEIIQE